MLLTAWNVLQWPESGRHLLLTFGGSPRARNRVRQRSEESYRQARIRLDGALIRTLADEMERLGALSDADFDWEEQFVQRQTQRQRPELRDVIDRLSAAQRRLDFEQCAADAFRAADYDRSSGGFRVLLESVGMLAGTGQYRFLTAGPDLLASLVGALSAEM